MNFKEKIWKALGITEAEYNKALEKHEREKMGCVSEYIDQRGKSMATACTSTAGQPYWGAAQQAVDLQQLKMQQQAMMNAAQQQMLQNQYAQQPSPVKKTFDTMNGGLLMPTFEELDDPDSVFNLPVEALATMWGARFGYRWVKDEDTAAALEENTNMWLTVLKRLSDAGRIEVQQFRHPEKLGYDTAWKLKEDHASN